ncbi:hypothetical protein M9Y10_017768 [Tritrichomonas musculus]|uniref:DUF3447 domain-containing protein n=1 Tax=Tritrichomonas musculus TaxID=1915356 RepID=A0ABR2HUS3_9EUKA
MEESAFQVYLEQMAKIEESFLDFLDPEVSNEDKFSKFFKLIKDSKICDDLYKFHTILQIIAKIGDNHHRDPNFFNKIFRILRQFKANIKNLFSNSEIFNIFKSNKRILLFLIEEQVLTFDEPIINKITTTEKFINANYPQYFQPEIEKLKELPENFYELRRKGENELPVCKLIQEDLVKEFIVHVNQSNIKTNDFVIDSSIYETNSFLIDRKTKLIEYAAFYGSVKIFKYLQMHDVQLGQSLWQFAIHGKNPEIIRFLEENQVENKSCKELIDESIKCHHNDIANYFLNNFLQNDINSPIVFDQSIKYYNFIFFPNEINRESFYKLLKYDHYKLIEILLENQDFNIDLNDIFLLIDFIQF